VDYDDWSIRQLQDECRTRGLPSGRSRSDLAQRLRDNDAKALPEVVAESDVPPQPAPVEADPQPPTPAVQGAATFRCTHPHPGQAGLDDQTHLAYRRRTNEQAVEAGHRPRGGELGAWRAGTTADGEVYEISIRQDTP
jgi:hypothetical protein